MANIHPSPLDPAAARQPDLHLPATAHRVMHDAAILWRNAKPTIDRLPGRRDLDPIAMPRSLLPHLWLLDVHQNAGPAGEPRFRYRLTGTHLDFGLGRTKTSQWVHELTPDFESNAAKHRHFFAAAREGIPHYRRGQPNFKHNEAVAELERVILPLAADGRSVDVLLCATVFYRSDGSILNAPI